MCIGPPIISLHIHVKIDIKPDLDIDSVYNLGYWVTDSTNGLPVE